MNYNKNWYNNLNKSSLTPPDWVFSVVWPILYTTMCISLYLVWTDKQCSPFCNPLLFFFIQLFFNVIWTTLFFKLQKPLWSLIDIIFVLLFTIITLKQFYKINKSSSYILIPYVIWLSFASYLNLYIVVNN